MTEVEGDPCTCDDDYGYPCDVHVKCDSGCQALREPVTPAEVVEAYVHWKSHSTWGGCSHGN